MLCYQAFWALRDSDKQTFENRLRESWKFLEKNHPGIRMYMIDSLGIDRKNCTKEQIPNLIETAPMFIVGHAQWGILCAVMIILNSRCGRILTLMHAFFLGVGANMYALRPYFFKFIAWFYRDGTPKYKNFSPCLPRKEFELDKLHIDKSDTFDSSFFTK